MKTTLRPPSLIAILMMLCLILSCINCKIVEAEGNGIELKETANVIEMEWKSHFTINSEHIIEARDYYFTNSKESGMKKFVLTVNYANLSHESTKLPDIMEAKLVYKDTYEFLVNFKEYQHTNSMFDVSLTSIDPWVEILGVWEADVPETIVFANPNELKLVISTSEKEYIYYINEETDWSQDHEVSLDDEEKGLSPTSQSIGSIELNSPIDYKQDIKFTLRNFYHPANFEMYESQPVIITLQVENWSTSPIYASEIFSFQATYQDYVFEGKSMSRGYVDILMSEQLAIGLTIPNKIFYSQELFGQLQFEIIVNHDAVYYLEPDGLIDASYIQKINEAILAYSNYDVGDSTGSDIGSSYINIGGDLYGYGAISQLIDPNAGDFDFGVYTEATLLDRNVEDFTVGISEFAPSLRSSNHLVTVKKDGSVWFVGGYAPFDHFSRGEKYKLPFADIIDIASSVNGIKAVDNAGRLLSFGGASYTRSELLLDKNVTSVSRAPGQYENRTLVIQDNDAIWFDHDDVPPQNILDDVWSTANARNHGYAIKLDGSLWGWDYQDVRGEGSKISNLRKYLDNVVAVSCDDHAAAAICADGTLWIWGEIISWFSMKDGPGESRPIVFGNPELEIDISEPFCLLDNVLAVSICDSHAIAVKDDGNIWTWGYNQNGQLCNGNTTSSWTPQPCGLALDLSQVKKSVLGETK